MILNGPNGTYIGATPRNEIKSSSVIRGEDRNENEIDGSVWSFSFSAVNPAGANDYFIHILNTDGSDYVITDFRLWATTATGNVNIHKVTGIPTFAGSTTINGLGRNTRFTQAPDIAFKTDTDITGMTDAGTYFTLPLDTVGELRHLRTTSGIILGSNGAVALEWTGATGEISGTISIAKITAK
jgi:hypothetical protein